jgi:N-acetylmuramoyl-L-alanine amidase
MVKIALDAGHGLKTAGKQTPNGIKEWTLNDKVRDKIVKFLNDYDVEIIHTDGDEGNTDEALTARRNAYVNAKAASFVSIHHNAYTGSWSSATGVEVYVDKNATSDDLKLANLIYTRLVKYTGLRGRGVKRADYTVIYQNKIPAVLVEGGFMDGSNDHKVITSDAGQEAYAKAVAEALIEFHGLKKKPEPVTRKARYKVMVEGHVTYDDKATATDLMNKLVAYGFNSYVVTGYVEEKQPEPAPEPPKKTVDELAREVIKGLWGKGADRKKRLAEAGYDYAAVQKRVNELL